MTCRELCRQYQALLADSPHLLGCAANLAKAHERMARAFARGRKLLVAGNGGSFADALHLCGELLKRFEQERPLPRRLAARLRRLPEGRRLAQELEGGLPAIALGHNGALLTAIINDKNDPRLVFAQEAMALGTAGDVFLGISTSGRAEDVLLAMSVAKAKGLACVTLTGSPGGTMAERADVAIRAPASVTARVQEEHVRLYHALCAGLERAFFPAPRHRRRVV